MIKSLPQFTFDRIISCLTSLGQFKGKIPAKTFKILDSKGHDVRRLFTQLAIIEKPKTTDEYLIWTSDGKELFELKDDDILFGDYLHRILLARIPQYKLLVDLLAKEVNNSFKKQEILSLMKEKSSLDGWNLPEPTFNGLILLAKTTSLLVTVNGSLKILEKASSLDLADTFNKCINKIFTKDNSDIISTESVLGCFVEEQSKFNVKISYNLAFDLLKDLRRELDLEFEFGIGTDVVPGTHALLKKAK